MEIKTVLVVLLLLVIRSSNGLRNTSKSIRLNHAKEDTFKILVPKNCYRSNVPKHEQLKFPLFLKDFFFEYQNQEEEDEEAEVAQPNVMNFYINNNTSNTNVNGTSIRKNNLILCPKFEYS